MGVLGSIIVIAGFVFFIYLKLRRNQRIQTLKTAYEQALRGTDKQGALAAGRAYYSTLRGTLFKDGLLTMYDEAAINNDISAMKV